MAAIVCFVSLITFPHVGCSGHGIATMQGVTFDLPESDSGDYTNSHTESRINSANIHIVLKQGHLQVNDKSYGTVAKGDRVKIGETGSVLVNGVERSSTPNN